MCVAARLRRSLTVSHLPGGSSSGLCIKLDHLSLNCILPIRLFCPFMFNASLIYAWS